MGLVREVDAILGQFRGVFSREAAFHWLVVITCAFMLRVEAFGITSLVRCLGLAPPEYHNLLHFFHSTVLYVQALCTRWVEIIRQCTQPVRIEALPLLVVDGSKAAKAGYKMPAVKLLHQESSNNTKPEYIMGHCWGAISALVTAGEHVFAIKSTPPDHRARPASKSGVLDSGSRTIVNPAGVSRGRILPDFAVAGSVLPTPTSKAPRPTKLGASCSLGVRAVPNA